MNNKQQKTYKKKKKRRKPKNKAWSCSPCRKCARIFGGVMGWPNVDAALLAELAFNKKNKKKKKRGKLR